MKKELSLIHNYRPSTLKTEKPPVIIMLHGYGSDENDLFSFASELPQEYAIVALKAPITMQPFGNAWYEIYFDRNDGKFSDDEQAIASRDLIVKVIDEIVSAYNVDPEQVTLLGFSQGTILSFAVALSYPEKVKNLIGLSGYINKNILKENYAFGDFATLNVYTSHGLVDQVIPVEWARETPSFLKALDIECQYSEYPVGHGVAPQNFYEFKEWLSQQ